MFSSGLRWGLEGLIDQLPGSKTPKPSRIAKQLKAQDMEKPQLQFEHVPTNMETGPFRPLLISKPHALVPLEIEPVATDLSSQLQYAAHISLHSPLGFDHMHKSPPMERSRRIEIDSDFPSRFPHPYQLEIEQYRYPSSVYTPANPIPYHSFDSTTATLVDTEEAVLEMLQELKQAKEIAIDLEHHDQRSYIGLVSLMQISTRDRDWIVDPLKPWRRKLQVLNEVLADPSIVKVLHGAYMDIMWLQRDLGLYVVGLFDTHYAARALGYTGGSLAFLLKKFANVDAQKQYQMADWRVRPLPQELFDYARSDTHYLLYIYDCMRNELIERSNLSMQNHEGDRLWDVLQKSSETALQRYEYPVYDSELGQGSSGWYKMLSRTPALLKKEQFAVFRAVHKWRDAVAREQDDSAHYIMPNHQVFSVARELPTNRAALLGIAQPTTQTVRLRADELVAVVVKAKEDGKTGPEMMDVLNKVEPHSSTGHVKRESQSHSVAAYVPQKTAPATVNGAATAEPTVLPLRSTMSNFWGAAFDSSAHHQQQQHRALTTAANDIQLHVPMPALTAEIFADSAEAASSTPVKAQPPLEPESTPAQTTEDEDIFVLKTLGKKRKRHDNEAQEARVDGVASQSDELALPDDRAEMLRAKTERKRAKKEAKRAAKMGFAEAAGELEHVNGQSQPEEPFDYATAPSILDPPKESREAMKERRKKEVNPYAKALDTPKGLPRVQRERAGKSMTYK